MGKSAWSLAEICGSDWWMSLAPPHPEYPNLHVLAHPLAEAALAEARRKDSDQATFARALERLSLLLAVEATRHLQMKSAQVDTPLETMQTQEIQSDIVLVPILRAGLALIPGFSRLLLNHQVCHIGLVRNEETLEPHVYLNKLIPLDGEDVVTIVLDPMLATGGSAKWAIQACKEKGAAHLLFCCVLAAPEGVRALTAEHPDVKIVTTALDRQLNDVGYILPGLGDAGDRYFGT